MHISDLPDKEFKIVVLRDLSELQGNTCNSTKPGGTRYEQNEMWNKEKSWKKKPSRNSRAEKMQVR